MPTFREDLHLGHEVTLVDTDDIRDKAITEQKLDDDSVSTRTIQDGAVTEPKLADDSVSTRTIQDRAVTEPKLADSSVSHRTVCVDAIDTENIRDNAVTTNKIANRAVTNPKIADQAVDARTIKQGEVGWPHLDDNLQNIIASREEGGVALAKQWGNSELVGITQKFLSEAHDDLQAQINAIVNDKATVTLTASPSVSFTNEGKTVTVTAKTDTTATDIDVWMEDELVAHGEGTQISVATEVDAGIATEITYIAEFTIAGLKKRTTAIHYVVDRIYFGSSADTPADTYITDEFHVPTARRTPAGTYSVVVEQNEDYIWFAVPATMSISKATMSGLDFPLVSPTTITINNVSYKLYRSANTYDAGTLTIVIS